MQLSSSSIKCACNHMTDCMVLVGTQDSAPASSTDYGLFKALSELRGSNLGANGGFIFAIVYSILYLVVGLVLEFVDKRRKNPQFFPRFFACIKGAKLVEQYEEKEPNEEHANGQKIRQPRVHPQPHPKRGDSTTILSMDKSVEFQEEQPIKARFEKVLKEIRAPKYSPNDVSSEQLNISKQSILIHYPKEGGPVQRASLSLLLKQRVLKMLENDKRRCGSFCKLAKKQIASNNQILNLLKRVSYVTP